MKKDCISASNPYGILWYEQPSAVGGLEIKREALTFLYSGSSILLIILVNSARIALAETPVAADLKSCNHSNASVSLVLRI